ncbi:MAG: hypothetical protein KAH22_12015 [Thiotrichaceae bacterium]|nr:hypothetical protein [Thiotrichaceae bacterium]
MFSIKIKKSVVLFNVVSICVISGIGAISITPNTADARMMGPRIDRVPSALRKTVKPFRPIRCAKGMHPFSRWIISPPNGLQRNAADIPNYLGGPRGFGQSTGINKWFTQTYYTRKFLSKCCRINRARVYVRGSHNTSPPIGPLTGNIPNNDVFAEFQNGVILSMPSAGSFPAAPNSTWRSYPVNANNAMTGGKLSFAIGDDTNVLQTALNVQGCCLNPVREPRVTRPYDRKAKALMKMIKMDKARKPRGNKELLKQQRQQR